MWTIGQGWIQNWYLYAIISPKTINQYKKSEKCRCHTLVDELMFDRENVVSHPHSSAFNLDGLKLISTP